MTEREIIIDWLVTRANDESHPNFMRMAVEAVGGGHIDRVDQSFKKHDALRAEFEQTYARGADALREYYSACTPESLVECFNNWACCKYR